jgi:hypothetical protein
MNQCNYDMSSTTDMSVCLAVGFCHHIMEKSGDKGQQREMIPLTIQSSSLPRTVIEDQDIFQINL